MFARRPKIDTTFGVPMDLSKNSGKMQKAGAPPAKTSARDLAQTPLIQEGGGFWRWLMGDRKTDVKPTAPKPRPQTRASSSAAPSSWGERRPVTPARVTTAPANGFAALISTLETLRRRVDNVKFGPKSLFNIARILGAIVLFVGLTEGRLSDALLVLAGWTVAGAAVAERLGLLRTTGFGAHSLPGLAGRSIAFTTGAMLGLAIGALAAIGTTPFPAIPGFIGVLISAPVYALVGGKIGEWVATKAERADLLGRPSL